VSRHRYALLAGGGTAGHLQPAIAIAEALAARGHDRADIEFVGSSRGQDREALGGHGFPVTLLPGRGIARSLRPRVVLQNLGAVVGLIAAAVVALGLVWRRRPRVVVSVGGYASLAASTAAVLLGVPLVLVNVDAVPGAANRLFGRFARASAVGWEDTRLPRAVVTGTPVRPAIAAVRRGPDDRAAARRQLGLPVDRATVVVFGGSLGARRINDGVAGLAGRWADRPDRSIYHIVGRRDWEAVTAAAGPPADAGVVVRVPYEERMDTAYTAADVVVCRAGAMTVAELSVAGVPSVLVPLPGAPGDHQTANARVLERAGGAVLLPDAECDGDRLGDLLDGLLDDPSGLVAMGRAAAAVGHPDAADAGARVVEVHARPATRGAPA
jgi:undecaprenyldiphospho-muramoylpentapeptide beta-N-acetylglucosaminyltransferase